VKINLHELLLENRRQSVESGQASFSERIAWKAWKQASLNRKYMNLGKASLKNWMVNQLFKGWTAHRGPLQFPEKTFNQRWRELS
jgi:L-lactate dehydrogenase complex protein LldF